VLAQCGVSAEQARAVREYIGKYLSTDLIYINQKRQITGVVEHLGAIEGQSREYRLLDGQTSLEDILGAIHLVETKGADHPMRHLVATSVVSHGVDIAELNFMVLDGWPRSTAEYSQASARSGRVQPGIIMSVLSSSKLFESGVFMNFDDYHFFLDKLVDSVPINRFAPNILQRTLPGVFSAVIYQWAKFQPGWGAGLGRRALDIQKVLNEPLGQARQKLSEMLIRALDVPGAIAGEFDIRVMSAFSQQLQNKVDYGLTRLHKLNASTIDSDLGEALESIYQFSPMRSFRDIENQLAIRPTSQEAGRLINALGK
jgi:hypothetical protein